MNNTGRTIAKNASALLLSQVVTWVLTLLLTIIMPRYLGSTSMGKIALANSVWAIGAMIVTFGMDTLLTKEIARRPEKAPDLFGITLWLRVLLHVGVFAAVWVYLSALRYPPETIVVVCMIGVASLFWSLTSACQATLQGLERMEYMTLGNIASKAVNTVFCAALLLLGQGVYAVAAVYVLSGAIAFVLQLTQVMRLCPLRVRFDWPAGRAMLRSGVPYLLSGFFLVLYAQVDVVVISLLVDEKTIGWYGAAGQLFGTLMFIPNVFITAVFPVLSRMYANTAESLPKLMRKSFDWLLLISIPMGLGLFVVADSLVSLLFGPDFAQSGPILALMGFVLILTYQNMLIGQFLVSTDRQNVWTFIMMAAIVVTVGLDLILVPWCRETLGNGAIGGAMSFIVTELGMVIFGMKRLPPGSLSRANLWVAARALFAGLVMVCATWWLRTTFILIPVVLGAAVYMAMVMVLRLVPAEDCALAREIVRSLRQRLSARKLRTG